MTQRLVEAAGSLLERRTSRRGMLARAALAGSAMVVAPWRFLTRPVSAMEVIGPGNCPSGTLCANGYSAFCCQVNHGANRCPPGTFIGGWWMCTAYSGGGLCHAEGVRYYVDCNCLPGHSCGGCRCANNTCSEMRIDCNVFRYGQCNTQVSGVTPVYCRVVVCQNPATINGFNCSSSVAVDDTAPYFVYLEGGDVHGEGSANNWRQIASLLRDAIADDSYRGDGERRTSEVDRVLASAGIGPGHPSLYPGRNAAQVPAAPAEREPQ